MIGREVYINDKESIHYKDWGVIVDYDGEYYHVAIFNDKSHTVIFERNQLYIPRTKGGKK